MKPKKPNKHKIQSTLETTPKCIIIKLLKICDKENILMWLKTEAHIM